MKRLQFNKMLFILLSYMVDDDVDFIIDYVLRSKEEQKRLFDKGLSKLDGTTKISDHQRGQAVDIYFMFNDKIDFGFESQEAKDYAKKYHELWEEMGGQPMIEWDKPHFGVK